jgi:subfamily B ATP-binding cassette protein MsbA
MKPFKWGLILLVFVTFVQAGANAARAWLIMPLFNQILLRGSSVVDNMEDEELAQSISKGEVDAAVLATLMGYNEQDPEAILRGENFGLGRSPVPYGDHAVFQEPLAKLFLRTRATCVACAEQIDQAERPIDTSGPWWQRWYHEIKDGLKLTQRADPTLVKKRKEHLARGIWIEACAEILVGKDKLATVPLAQKQLAAALSLKARHFANEALFQQLEGSLLIIFVASLIIAIFLGAGYFSVYYLARALTTRMVVDIQNRLAEHLLTLSIRYFNNERRGELFSRLTNDLTQLQAVLMLILSDLLIQPITLGVLIGAAVWQSFWLSLSLGVLALTVFVPVRVWGKRIRRSARSRQASVANVFEALQQMFAGIRIVKAFRREGYEMERFKHRTRDYLLTSLRVVWDRTASKSWMELINDITIPVVLLAGGTLVIHHQWGLDLGRFGTFLALVLMMYMPAKTLAASYNTLQDAAPSVDRVFEILDTKAEIVEEPGAVALGRIKDAIRFENVTFGYDPEKLILKNVSFTARTGEVTAIVGPTGGGKSTLVDLVARFYDPQDGRVTVDGIDLRKAQVKSLIDKIAVVTQDPFVFNDTIRENIRYGRLDATDAEIEAAAKAAQLHDEIMAKQEGYGFVVGERGAKLSGGQKQRLTIARAIVKNPEILILDEATGALDADTERRVQKALEELEHGRTTFVIAHRLSTIQTANNILVINEGQLVEEGRHEELVARGGLYASLVKTLSMPGANGNGNGNGNGHRAASDVAKSEERP